MRRSSLAALDGSVVTCKMGSVLGRVLIVDDDPAFTRDLALSFSRRGWFAESAGGYFDALRRMRTGAAPDLLIVDVRLEDGQNGIGLLEELREDTPYVRAVMVSCADSAELAVAALKAGALDYAVKPVTADALLACVASQITVRQYADADQSLAMAEWKQIQLTWKRYNGNYAKASRALGIAVSTLRRKLRDGPPPR